MRELINKLTLLESSNVNITKIASFFTPRENDIIFSIVFELPFIVPYVSSNKQKLTFNLDYTVDETGHLDAEFSRQFAKWSDEWKQLTDKLSINELQPHLEQLEADIVNDIILDEYSKIRSSVRDRLVQMGFSLGAAEDFANGVNYSSGYKDLVIDLPKDIDWKLTGKFNSEINAAFEYRRAAYGDM